MFIELFSATLDIHFKCIGQEVCFVSERINNFVTLVMAGNVRSPVKYLCSCSPWFMTSSALLSRSCEIIIIFHENSEILIRIFWRAIRVAFALITNKRSVVLKLLIVQIMEKILGKL